MCSSWPWSAPPEEAPLSPRIASALWVLVSVLVASPAGAATLAVFGIATIPALYLTGLSGARIAPAWRARLGRAAGLVLIVLGLLTTARGAAALANLNQPPDAAATATCHPART